MAISTTLDEVRLLIGDTDTNNALLSDEELEYFLSEQSDNPLLAAAAACDALATKFARYYDFTTDGQTFRRSTLSEAFSKQAKILRGRAHGATSIATTTVDGYSQDEDSEAVDSSAASPRRKFYGQEDVPW